jgi:hypothetical protein
MTPTMREKPSILVFWPFRLFMEAVRENWTSLMTKMKVEIQTWFISLSIIDI